RPTRSRSARWRYRILQSCGRSWLAPNLVAPDFLIERHELDICLESRLGKSCDPPEFRRNLAPSNENEAKVRDFPPGVTGHSGARVKRACPKIHNHHREYG